MNFFDKLKTFFTVQTRADDFVLWLYVKCKRCGAPVAVRVNLRNDPSLDDESNGYILRKEIMDSQCFTLMHAELELNAAHKIVSQTIDKGEFLTREQYVEMTNAK